MYTRLGLGQQDLEATKRPSKAVHYTGWEESLEVLHRALRTERIDGVLGRCSLRPLTP